MTPVLRVCFVLLSSLLLEPRKASAQEVTPVNLVANPGFETGTKDPWVSMWVTVPRLIHLIRRTETLPATRCLIQLQSRIHSTVYIFPGTQRQLLHAIPGILCDIKLDLSASSHRYK